MKTFITDPFNDTLLGKCCVECFRYFSEDGVNIYQHGEPTICLECSNTIKLYHGEENLQLNKSDVNTIDFG